MEQQKEFVYRHYADGTYGVGEVVIPAVALFRLGNYDLTKEEADAKWAAVNR
jgi:hypothetical protein